MSTSYLRRLIEAPDAWNTKVEGDETLHALAARELRAIEKAMTPALSAEPSIESRVADIESAVRSLVSGGIEGAMQLVCFVDKQRDVAEQIGYRKGSRDAAATFGGALGISIPIGSVLSLSVTGLSVWCSARISGTWYTLIEAPLSHFGEWDCKAQFARGPFEKLVTEPLGGAS